MRHLRGQSHTGFAQVDVQQVRRNRLPRRQPLQRREVVCRSRPRPVLQQGEAEAFFRALQGEEEVFRDFFLMSLLTAPARPTCFA